MDRSLYLAMAGAKQTMLAQQTNAHNLANANTPGFRADFDSFMTSNVSGPGYKDRAYALDNRSGSNMDAGAVVQTGRDLDVAVTTDGWIAVQAEDGTEAYTRRGDFQVSAVGLLETGDGKQVMGNGGPISIPPAEKLEIAKDGTISIVPLGQEANTLVVLDRIKLVKPEVSELQKGLDGLFHMSEGQQAEASAEVFVQSGSLESSNVNNIDALVKMIDYSRMFETQMKVIAATSKNDEASSSLLQSS